MRTTPPPLPGTWQHVALTTGRVAWIIVALTAEVAVHLFAAFGNLVYYAAIVCLVAVAWPILLPLYLIHLFIKHAVAAGVRAGNS